MAALVALAACSSSGETTLVVDGGTSTADVGTVTTTDAATAGSSAPSTTTTTSVPPTSDVSTTSTTTTSTTTTAATTTSTVAATTTTTPPVAPPPSIDLAAGSLGGYSLLSPAATLIDEFTESLGEPAVDTGWVRLPPTLVCTGASEYRDLLWGDLRVVLERSTADEIPAVGSWSLGDRDTISPMRPSEDSGDPVDVTTTEGVGIGSSPDEVTTVERTDTASGFVVIGPAPVIVDVADDRITGFAVGRLDCLDPPLSQIPCDTPIPIPLLPDGSVPAPAVFDDDTVIWQATADGPIVTQTFEAPSADTLATATAAPIGARIAPLDVRVLPASDARLDASTFYVFDDRSDCVRVLDVAARLSVQELNNYALFLADRLTPRR